MVKRAVNLCLVGLLVLGGGTASAATFFAPPSATSTDVVPVAASCSAIGQQVAASKGGTLVRATPTPNGQCRIVIVVPGRNGERTRRIEMTVPAQ